MGRCLNWVAMGPSVAGGTLLWLMTLALLPSTAAGVAACGFAGLLAFLFVGGGEGMAVIVLTGGRRLSHAETALLAPSVELLAGRGFEIGEIYASRGNAGGLNAQPIGRRSLLVSPVLVDRVATGSLDLEAIAVVMGHAEATRRTAGSMRHDVAARLLGLPWLVVAAGLRRMGHVIGWLPGVRLMPPIALIVGGTATWMAAADHLWWLVVVLMAAIGLTIGTPPAQRSRRRKLQRGADELLIVSALGTQLLSLLSVSATLGDPDRVKRVELLVHGARPHLHLVPSVQGHLEAGRLVAVPVGSAKVHAHPRRAEPNPQRSALSYWRERPRA